MRTWNVFCATVGAVALALASTGSEAAACGVFTPRPNPERVPSLAYEQALIVHDAAKGREHFLREIVFRADEQRFGFVVPTPTRPDVAKVDKSPFPALREQFPFERPPPVPRGEGIGLGGLGTFGHGGGAGVTVLDVQKVGSFTAFVLAADDASALAKWLDDNGLSSTPETEAWLAHYVKAKFHYVAMRYDAPAKAPKPATKPPPHHVGGAAPVGRTRSEVVRISFDAPRAYFPYREPAKRQGDDDEARMLEIWLATTGATTQPVGARLQEGKVELARPFSEGQRFEDVRPALASLLGADASLLPNGVVRLQRFMDQKRRRSGWGDVLFVPERRDPGDAARDASLKAFAPVLDATLLSGGAR